MKKFTFTGSQGHELAARLDMPDGPVRAHALFAHCFTCGKDLQPANRIAKTLNDAGIAVLRFDFTGLGKSGGEFENTNFSSNVADLVAAADHMRETLAAPTLMIGHSLGGTATLLAAAHVPEARAVATIGSPSNATNVLKQFECDVAAIDRDGEADVSLAGRPFKIRKQFLDDARGTTVADTVATLRKAVLFLHAPLDDTVAISHAGELFGAAKHPKSFISMDKADHLLFNPGAAEYAARSIAAWAEHYLPAEGVSDEGPEDSVVAGEGVVAVHPTGNGKFQTHIHAGPHGLIADEPKSVGGDDTGPTPYGLLLAALGACTSMTLRMYAARKGLDLRDVEVHLVHDKIHAADCEACETERGKVDKISREIVLKGDLSPQERVRLIEIADMCPVHKTLHGEVLVETVERTS